MSLPDRIAAYEDCLRVYEGSPCRVAFATFGEAKYFCMRMHKARSLEREDAQRLYPKDDPRWGRSQYDKFVVNHPVEDESGEWWVYIREHGANIIAIEPIPEIINGRTP